MKCWSQNVGRWNLKETPVEFSTQPLILGFLSNWKLELMIQTVLKGQDVMHGNTIKKLKQNSDQKKECLRPTNVYTNTPDLNDFKRDLCFALVPRLKRENLTATKSAHTLKLPWRSQSHCGDTKLKDHPSLACICAFFVFVHFLSSFVCCLISKKYLWRRWIWSDIPPSPCSVHTRRKKQPSLLRRRRGSANAST